ncbi:hypothetical protein FHS99_000239 [Sphingomonas prati]|uniref:DUF2155 domain-containing protein n=1 Tax=Sphingomonas prati TaxID=1843237 RepID=A0A7W9BPK1_9SPHN|nr:hypothetical protein [Sphingomonas prati]
MKTAAGAVVIAAGLGLMAWQVSALQGQEQPAPQTAAPRAATPDTSSSRSSSRTRTEGPAAEPLSKVETPMAQRVAVLGVLNKRNGLSRDLSLRPGQAVRLGDLVVRLRACAETAPWEPEHLTGAFVQTDVQGRDTRWRRVFSGWLYKESPSLNAVQHPVYDVWPKSCTMRHPDMGPATIAAGAGGVAPSAAGPARRSSAPKSPITTPVAAPTPSAASSNDT